MKPQKRKRSGQISPLGSVWQGTIGGGELIQVTHSEWKQQDCPQCHLPMEIRLCCVGCLTHMALEARPELEPTTMIQKLEKKKQNKKRKTKDNLMATSLDIIDGGGDWHLLDLSKSKRKTKKRKTKKSQ